MAETTERENKTSEIKPKETPTEHVYVSNFLRNPSETIKTFGSILSAFVGAASLFYAIGFVIVNIHLSKYGIRDFELARPTYLSAGISFVVFHTVMVSIVVSSISIMEHIYKSKTKNQPLFLLMTIILGSIVSTGAFPITITALTFTSNPGTPVNVIFGQIYKQYLDYLLFIGFGTFWLLLITMMPLTKSPSKHGNRTKLFAGIFVMFFLLTLVFYGVSAYPKLPSALGGGSPVGVKFVINEDVNPDLLTEVNLPVAGYVSSTVLLLDETNKSYIVLLDDGNALRLDKSLIINILYLH